MKTLLEYGYFEYLASDFYIPCKDKFHHLSKFLFLF